MAETEYDIAIIGAGPGGYVAAIRAAQLSLKTVIVERKHLGGICLNWGCIPTKALLATSELYHKMRNANAYGVAADGVRYDLEKVVQRSREVAEKLSNGVAYLMRKKKIPVIDGTARLKGNGVVGITGKDGQALPDISTKHIVIATGARARTAPGLEPDGWRIWTYKEAMVPKEFPRSLLVIGSGAIGIEFASFYHTLGAEVIVVEMLPRILPADDEEISTLALKAFRKQGMRIETSACVEALRGEGDRVRATIVKADGARQEIGVDRAILAIGIAGNIENIGLEAAGVETAKGHILIDEWCRTSADGIYAIGDVVGPPWLAHKASHEGVLCVEKIAGLDGVHPLDVSKVPACTYCWPQIASVGLTEAAALDAGHDVSVGRFPYSANGKAIALGETEGLIKTVFDAQTGELLGAHMIGAEVTELIQGFAIARELEATEAELIRTIFPHPTLSETMHESVLDAFGRPLHI